MIEFLSKVVHLADYFFYSGFQGVPCKKRRKVIHENGGSCVDRDGLNENGDGGLLTIKSKKLQTGHDEVSDPCGVKYHRLAKLESVQSLQRVFHAIGYY